MSNLPAIPDPQLTLESLRETALALKEAVENFAGTRGPASTTVATATQLNEQLATQDAALRAYVNSVGAVAVSSVTATSPLASSGGTTPAISLSGTVGIANGGTGQTSYTDGQLLIGNTTGNTLTKATLTAGTNVTITNGGGSITIAATGGDLTSRMTSNVDFTSTTTFGDLTGLSFTADASSIYVVEAFIYVTFAGAGKFKLRVTGPSSTEIFFGGTENNGPGLNVTSAGTTTAFSSDLFNFTTGGAVTTGIAHLYGTFNVGGSGGTVQIQGTQAASNATTTSFKTGSWVQYRKVT